MCFYIDKDYPQRLVAKEDIECIKLMINVGGVFYSPYYGLIPYQIGDTMVPDDDTLPIDSNYSDQGEDEINFVLRVNHGIHSYLKDYIIKYHYRQLMVPHQEVYAIKCIIPKGEKYFINHDHKEYVSSKLILKEIIQTYKDLCEFVGEDREETE